MLAEVKRALRISHTVLDSDISATIDAACADMVRAGVSSTLATSTTTDSLVKQAIKSYCMAFYSNSEKLKEGYQKSYESILENIRRSEDYVNLSDDSEE